MYVYPLVFDRRVATIPEVRDAEQRNMHYRRYRTGIHNMSVYTADDMEALLQQMHYAVGTGNTVIPAESVRHAFVRACVATIKILLVTKKRTVCAADLTLFDEQVCVMMLLLYLSTVFFTANSYLSGEAVTKLTCCCSPRYTGSQETQHCSP